MQSLMSPPGKSDDFPDYGSIATPRTDYKRRVKRDEPILSTYNLGTIANILSTLISGSMFSLPWSFHMAGVVGGTVVVLFIALISYETTRTLLCAQREVYLKTGEVVGYPELAEWYLGSHSWSKAIQTATVISCIGGNIGYLIFIGGLAEELLATSLLDSILVACVPLILLSWMRSFQELSVFTTVGVFSNLGALVAVFVIGSNLNSQKFEVVYLKVYPTLMFVGSATFMFGIHYCIVSMGAEILTRYKQKNPIATPLPTRRLVTPLPTLEYDLGIAYAISTIGIILLGVFGSIMYSGGEYVRDANGSVIIGCEDKVCQNVILNLPSGIIRNVIGVALIIAILATYTLFLVPAREHIEKKVISWIQPKSPVANTWTRNGVRTMLVLGTAVVAHSAPYFGGVLTTVGGITDAFQIYVIPAFIYLKMLDEKRISNLTKYFYYFMIVWGCGLIAFTLYNTIQASFLAFVLPFTVPPSYSHSHK